MMKENLILTNWHIEFLIGPEECLSYKNILSNLRIIWYKLY
ncbi:hypothetical protein LKF67_2269 [Lactococcus lactis subsp. lactis]|nr:hypothetical protein BSR25_1468 [Lactococcus lactis subsp. lactis bv. diacetylactis]KST77713.1 hypothetical protein LK231_1752 [Lactococcus lactis subsp. lactis]KST88456.1 hypothetical protein LKF67_2269 [Lactococcus lactis subsp. lactis]KST95881.1 hypothetical protein KF146_1913 [Lactococcus lactis subsp. lactis]KST98479.1 hypothetical protein KF196_1447 [Lactococcus lactis subsp. lactis]